MLTIWLTTAIRDFITSEEVNVTAQEATLDTSEDRDLTGMFLMLSFIELMMHVRKSLMSIDCLKIR